MKDFLKGVVFVGLFAVPFLTLYVETDYFFPYITGKNFWFRIIVDITFAAWIILAFLDVKYRPKFSWVLVSFAGLLGVMFVANLFGADPNRSFWSNLERMDGYVSLVHTFLYAVILGSVLKTKEHWQRLLMTSLVVAFFVALYGLAQYGGMVDGNGRIDSRLGNAAYMAIYMLFHIFIAFWLFVETKVPWQKWALLILAALMAFVLIETGTRGTAVGMVVGVAAMAGYIALFGKQYPQLRKYAIGAFALVAILAVGFVAARDTAVVQENNNLARIANISFEDLETRTTIWGIAWEGVKERPVLGWGQGNFGFVFNQYYEPSLYDQEQWFDRSHSIFMDWLIAGGVIGLLAYLSIFVACLWYVVVRPFIHKDDNSFTVLERGVLLGILAGYFTHNLVVFDNIISYIFFAIILGLIHSRVATPISAVENITVDTSVIKQAVAPAVAALLIGVMYFLYAPGMGVASDLIDALRTEDPAAQATIYQRALERDSFARQEVVEQLVQEANSAIENPNITPEQAEPLVTLAEEQLLTLIADKPGNARLHVFAATLYRTTGEYGKAAEQLQLARELSPEKQSIIYQQGVVAGAQGDQAAAEAYFAEAFALDESNIVARSYYIAALLQSGNVEAAEALLSDEAIVRQISSSDIVAQAAYEAGANEILIRLFEYRTELQPTVAQNWATLAYLYYDNGQSVEALAALENASLMAPDFADTATCYADNIRQGREPQIGC